MRTDNLGRLLFIIGLIDFLVGIVPLSYPAMLIGIIWMLAGIILLMIPRS